MCSTTVPNSTCATRWSSPTAPHGSPRWARSPWRRPDSPTDLEKRMLNGERHRSRLLAALAAALLMVLTACGGSGGDDGGPVELRYSWWGNADRAELMQQAIAI